jgi:hypothetical protein
VTLGATLQLQQGGAAQAAQRARSPDKFVDKSPSRVGFVFWLFGPPFSDGSWHRVRKPAAAVRRRPGRAAGSQRPEITGITARDQ